jgi:hypothetical protein
VVKKVEKKVMIRNGQMLSRVLLCFIGILVVQSIWAAEPADPMQAHTGSGMVEGTITDPSGAVVPNVKVEITNPVTNYQNSAVTNQTGYFVIQRVPFNNYQLTVTGAGFAPLAKEIDVRSVVPLNLPLTLQIASAQTSVTVQGGSQELLETTPTNHTDISSQLISKLPVESAGSGLSSIITQATPGVVADSNGMFHPLGEHADTTFSIDGQPVSDQQSRVFSNQIAPDVISSMEVITGVPPAEYGGKASLIVRTTTKSGLGVTQPTGSVTASYGSFGTSNLGFNLAAGTDKFGNFLSVNGLNSGRFLDSPEFLPLHDKGNSESIFDHIDYQISDNDLLHLNLSYARSWFQIPNTYTQQSAGQDQRQEIKSFNIAPSYSHQFTPNLLFSTTAYVRQDRVGYFPSADPFQDLPVTLSQNRRLTNAGIKADVSYTKGIHNARAGVEFDHTFLNENFSLGITDPTFNDPSSPDFQSGLLPYDLTRGGSPFVFHGQADIKQESAYVQDTMSLGNWQLMLGLRGDNYNGLSQGSAVQPRVGVSYNVKKTGTVLRGSYGRIFLTPYNENLVLSSSTGLGGLAAGAFSEHPITPAMRNQFDVGFEQAFSRRLVITGEYFWKFTTGDYDFDTILNTPLTFPIQWRKSKIDGASVRVNFPAWHGLTAYSVMGHTRARFFGPEVGGIIFNSPLQTGAFRIDHDQAFEQTTHLQYQFSEKAPWFGFTWTYESGMVAGDVPDFATALTLTGDEQAQMGLFCGSTFATVSSPIRSCASGIGATRVVIPPDATYNPDTNPARIAPRNLFDAAVGFDNIFHGEHYKWDLQLSAVNLTNNVALYNFLSTFSGTHFVTPRTFQAQLSFRF